MKLKIILLDKQLSFLLLFFGGIMIAQTTVERQLIQSKSNISRLNTLATDFNEKYQSQKQEAIQIASAQNIPVRVNLEDGGFAELQRFADDGSPIYYSTYNVDAARSTRTNHLNIGGSLGLSLDGQDMTAYVWDGGHARVSHQEYDGAGGTNRVTIQDTGSEGGLQLNFHAAHVTGTIAASGVQPDAKGMAPKSRVRGYMWNNDISEATSAAASGMLVSNHSYGFRSDQVPDQWFGAYIQDSRDWDNVMYNAPYYLMVVAAGNDGNTNHNGSPLNGNSAYDKLTGHATSKNNMVVANAQDATIANNGDLISVSINSSSSEGPTDDLRIKPDITGNGTDLYSTYASSDTAYASITGTSMASPNVTGSLLLLQQHYNVTNASFMRSATLKGLALHTADDAGPAGPDAVYGWGLLNAKLAAETISENGVASRIEELTLSSGQSYTTTADSDGINDLMASISWTDVPGVVNSATNSPIASLVNDLDIRVTQGGTTFNPWRLTGITTNGKGDNTKDNYERVDISVPAGTYTITVTHKGSLSGGSQNFSIILTGLGNVIADTEVPTTPAALTGSNVTDTEVDLSWVASTDNTSVIGYDLFRDDVYFTTVSGIDITISGLSPNTAYAFKVRAKDAAGNLSGFSNTITITTVAPIPVYCDSASLDISDEYISNVTLNTIDNNSDAQLYSDFTSISTDLDEGETYTISVTPTWTGTIYDEGYAVWIDYNNDFDFDDAGELVWSKAPSQDTSNNGTFTIPDNVNVGATRMRVSMRYNGTPLSPCQILNYGEVEDYTVVLDVVDNVDNEAPTVPTSLLVSSITQTTANFSWNPSTDNVGVVAYDLYQDDMLLISTTSTGYLVTGLSSATGYVFYVKARDAAGNESTRSNTSAFSTLPAPDTEAPTNPSPLTGSNITQTTVDLNWIASTDNVAIAGYDVYQDDNLMVTSSGIDYTATGLTENTNYTFYVSARDAAGNTTESNSINITTLSSTAGGYCSSTSSNVNDEYISRVQLNTFDNTSGAQFYSDFTAISTDLFEGQTYTISVTPTWVDIIYSEGYAVWIDYNNDLDFDDVSELVWSKEPSQDTPNEGTFTIPSGVTYGQTRMRVSMQYNAVPTSCESFYFGEVEDYTVNLGEYVDMEPPSTPLNLTATNITVSSLELNWDQATDNVGVTEYDVYGGTTLIATIADTSINPIFLDLDTTYSYYVIARDLEGNISLPSETLNIRTLGVDDPGEYCLSYGRSILYEYISRVQLNTIDYSSVGDYYSNFSETVFTDLTLSESYTITITPIFNGTVFDEGYAVWIDYNQDFDFDDPGELVWSKDPSQETLVSGSFVVPVDAPLGPTRMRVSFKYFDIPDPCEVFAFGEVEDYTVNITDTEAPSTPSSLSALNITDSTVELDWNASIDNSGNVEYFVYQDGSFITSVSEENTTIEGLEPNTEYSYYVRAIDPSGNPSALSNEVLITTDFGEPVILGEGYFESGWDGWRSSNNNNNSISRYKGADYSFEGLYSVEFRQNRPRIFLGKRVPLQNYENVNINFYFHQTGLRYKDGIFIEIYTGSKWEIIGELYQDVTFNDEQFYNVSITLDNTEYIFSRESAFRFRSKIDSEIGALYVDQVIISANVSRDTVEGVFPIRRASVLANENPLVNGLDFLIYPNPANSILNVKTMNQVAVLTYSIYNIIGQQIAKGTLENDIISVQNISSGIYILELNDGSTTIEKRFIKE
ncbi:GEVED domain-containing protein [Patiriisocius sp. Uisw_017]|uniref:GEVED domain-containing protein n=1 Tax=Patiriisocius sp. Uisw_017 TaxID=3230968 RepID=UPI0039E8A427